MRPDVLQWWRIARKKRNRGTHLLFGQLRVIRVSGRDYSLSRGESTDLGANASVTPRVGSLSERRRSGTCYVMVQQLLLGSRFLFSPSFSRRLSSARWNLCTSAVPSILLTAFLSTPPPLSCALRQNGECATWLSSSFPPPLIHFALCCLCFYLFCHRCGPSACSSSRHTEWTVLTSVWLD